MDNCFRNCSFCSSNGSAVAVCAAVSILDSDKELLFPCARTAEAATKHDPIANCQMPIANLKRGLPRLFIWQLEIGNWKFLLLRHLRRMRTVFLKHARRRKFTELVTDHVLGNENRIKGLSVVHQERVADKIRRHHRAPRPGLDRFLGARAVHFIDLLKKMRLDEGSLL